jgi:hypothetical protein
MGRALRPALLAARVGAQVALQRRPILRTADSIVAWTLNVKEKEWTPSVTLSFDRSIPFQ